MTKPELIYHHDDKIHCIRGSNAVFLCVYSGSTFVATSLSNLDQFSIFRQTLLNQFKKLDGVKAKIIGDYLLSRQIQRRLCQENVQIEKAIYATSYVLYYSPQTGEIKLSKKPIQTINVLIVDDSKTIREVLKKSISSNPKFKVVGELENGQNVAEKIEELNAHVITLDMQMPILNGVQALKQFFPRCPIPSIVVSAVSLEEGSLVMDALEAGAFDYLQKPIHNNFEEFRSALDEKIVAAFLSKYKVQERAQPNKININIDSALIDTDKLVAIGSSTGGIEALREILVRLPKNIPPIIVIQHIPAGFSKAFAERMNTLCPFLVKEGENGDEVKPGVVYIAAGGMQTSIQKVGEKYFLQVNDDPPMNRHKPSVDYTFFSLAKNCHKKVISIMLTGMGSDGSKGMQELKNTGSLTIAQNEESCVVFGMPQAAIKLGCVDHIVDLKEIASKALFLLSSKTKSKAVI